MNAQHILQRSIDEITDAIAAGGHLRTVLVQGHMGTGKSSILSTLAERFPGHVPCYFDCTTKDLGDITVPKMKDLDGHDFVRFATNEELGIHYNKPVIIMIDEYGKANPAVKNALLRLMLERKVGTATLHPDSIIFATTNLGAEGVGDLLPPHSRNRITVVTMRKPTAEEWIEWGIKNNIHPSVLAWAKETPQLFQSFDEVKDPKDNPYIYHPKDISNRPAFVTGRSLESASDWIHLKPTLGDSTVQSMVAGAIGARGALDLMAYAALADDLPTLQEIKKTPKKALVPKNPAALCMVVYRTLATIDEKWVDAWVEYLRRMEPEAQGLFANGVRSSKYDSARQKAVFHNQAFAEWAVDHGYMFATDKK